MVASTKRAVAAERNLLDGATLATRVPCFKNFFRNSPAAEDDVLGDAGYKPGEGAADGEEGKANPFGDKLRE
ncbi:MAG: hypothetical protein AAF663_09645 [Planctomycetota bacterium]